PRTAAPADADSPGSASHRDAASGQPEPPSESASESTGAVPQFGESGLPKRRRGRTLAAAEARTATPGEAEAPRPRTTDPKVQAARFSTFSQAVRANSPHPEGNTR
ncbi:ATP-binding protein, partial [Streptomyces sp. NE06-03E]|nr:ATP-binding protein [Streptomyces sp. NE06-03E]